jgi:hypothetical protein
MKKLLFFCFISLFFQISSFSQSCLPEGITFTSQAQIDSFQVNYPGCSTIEGDVTIAGDDISNLVGLDVIDSILGRLDIWCGYDLTDLAGFENLKYIGENLNVENCEYLRYFSGLNNLTTINGSLDIEFNNRLTSISGLANLSSVREVIIIANLELVSFSGIGGLDSITGDLSIENNYMLSSLDGLASLTKINGEIVICYNESLATMTGLDGLTSIGDALRIYENHSLVSLSGLDNVDPSSIGIIEIWHNPLLSDCDIQSICNYLSDPRGIIAIYKNAEGCNNPHEIADSCGFTLSCLPFGYYYFLSQEDVDSFPSYYSNCNNLAGSVHINGVNIVNLDSLIGIDTISGFITLCGNNNLTSLEGLNNLRYVQMDLSLGYWECGSNPRLTSLSGLNKLTSVGNAVLIMGNDGLLNLEGLDSLCSIGYSLSIYENASLKNLDGINNLKSAGSIDIGANDSLLSLDGLQGLINVQYGIEIGGNPLLKAIDGIENVEVDSLWFLKITNNDTLTECNIKSVCDYLKVPEGNIEIHDNATGCNSPEEVELACGVGVEEVVSCQLSVVSYPNPFSSQTTFNIRLENSARVNLTVFNNLGQVVATILDKGMDTGDYEVMWDAGAIAPGLYFYQLKTSNSSSSGKLVRMK